METFKSDLSGNEFPSAEKVSGKSIRKGLYDLIRQDHPHFNNKCHLALSELTEYKQRYYEGFFSHEIGQLTEMEKQVMAKLKDHESITDKLDTGEESLPATYGERLADKIADFGGSWTFILIFLFFICAWMAVNIYLLANKGFDPYPFILLNLILSCLAALQAPVIMMSQNRQESKDRQRAKNDYMINLKSELEVRILHDKIDHLLLRQQQDMMELQQAQMDTLREITHALKLIHQDVHKGNKGDHGTS
ncbi:DUF1003 domain-containing protein [Chitinophaga pendula]|uniref:DUF1003 domain-containing protein n=1 Tax=Chitinophaga TaxID=79328 RepID=UPI000BAEDF7F|nr:MULTISPECIES: DUF1003 domain-containing protein [Chitinophaga]ASZ10839.1 hypothetical protein CK934_07535 [Chitinophaga sp. MD30]UCJ06181.1 DUF1003 domain-containing protein [Chitinophaga pendula]